MTDDEAFIRAIVHAPGDDAPRLIYADWLDERGDARGEYLRAEANSDNLQELRLLASRLNQLWVSRVSRPPMGVCCDRVRFRDSYPRKNQVDVHDLEKRLGIVFPTDYRAFILNYNGGSARPNRFPIGNGEFESVYRFFGVEAVSGDDEEPQYWNLEWELQQVVAKRARGANGLWTDRRGLNLIPIAEGVPATEWSHLCIGIEGEQSDSVFLVDSSLYSGDDSVRRIASSLPEFLALLRDTRPDWVRLIHDGDTAGFASWVKSGGDINERYRERPAAETTPLLTALEWDQQEIVRILVKQGATVPADLWDVYESLIPRNLVRKVRPGRRRWF